MPTTPLQHLAEHGQSAWIDDLCRRFIQDGDLSALNSVDVVGVASIPTCVVQ